MASPLFYYGLELLVDSNPSNPDVTIQVSLTEGRVDMATFTFEPLAEGMSHGTAFGAVWFGYFPVGTSFEMTTYLEMDTTVSGTIELSAALLSDVNLALTTPISANPNPVIATIPAGSTGPVDFTWLVPGS